ncbi:MAG: RagB/SusD family nutrient uptake outer membrane protein [Bacteroidales bacterium]|nr:RagB/SusD family nutrient uptake outer membrane protein [Bacteroidales bacterium]
MKKSIIISIAAVCLIATACNDEFLEKYPKTDLTEQNTFLDYNGFKAFMYPCYDLFFTTAIATNFNTNHCGSQLWGDIYAGILTSRDNVAANSYAYRTVTPNTNGGGWDFSYIRRINIMLSHVNDGGLSEADAKHWEAVGRFFRAWWYMELVDRFGDVPWVDKVLDDSSPEAYGTRTRRDTVVTHICEDFEFAIDNIGDDVSKDGTNPLTADACRAAYSRFLLREGTWAKYHKLQNEDPATLLKKCQEVSKVLMDKYTTLYEGTDECNPGTGYGELWTTESLKGVPGVIFSQEYVTLIKMHRGNDFEHIAAHYSDAPQHTIDMFLMKNGKPISNSESGYEEGDIYANFRDRDPRLYLNIQPPYLTVAQNFAEPDLITTFPKWRFANVGETIGSYTVKDEADSAKLREYIDLMGANKQCVRGGDFGGTGMKRCPGQNWGADMVWNSPNLYDSGTKAFMKCRTGYYFWKNYDMWEYATGSTAECTADKPIFKIEEVLLNYAEAAFELGTFNQSVADITINKLRERVGMPAMILTEINADFDPARDKGNAPWLTGELSKYEVDPVLWEIRRERQIELFGEGFGFYDVRRWGKADYYINRQPCGMYIEGTSVPFGNGSFTANVVDYNTIKTSGKAEPQNISAGAGWLYTAPSPLTQGGGWIDTYYLTMVPTREIVLNPQLTQNPGYKELFNL